jgi:hypothetical protein
VLTRSRWLKKCELWNEQDIQKLDMFEAKHPPLDILKSWIRYWAADSQGMLDEKAVESTIINTWKSLSSWLKRATGKAVDKAITDEMLNVSISSLSLLSLELILQQFIRHDLKVLENIKAITQEKNTADRINYSQFME